MNRQQKILTTLMVAIEDCLKECLALIFNQTVMLKEPSSALSLIAMKTAVKLMKIANWWTLLISNMAGKTMLKYRKLVLHTAEDNLSSENLSQTEYSCTFLFKGVKIFKRLKLLKLTLIVWLASVSISMNNEDCMSSVKPKPRMVRRFWLSGHRCKWQITYRYQLKCSWFTATSSKLSNHSISILTLVQAVAR